MENQVPQQKESTDHQRERSRRTPLAMTLMKDRTGKFARRSDIVEYDRLRLRRRAAIHRRQSARHVRRAKRAEIRIHRDVSTASRTLRIDLIAQHRRRRRLLLSAL